MARFPAQLTVVRPAVHRRSRVTVHFLAWTAVFLCLAPVARAQYLADGIAAVVNDKIITYVQINQNVAETVELLRQNYQGQDYIMVSGKFHRLTASDATSRLREIISWLVSLRSAP